MRSTHPFFAKTIGVLFYNCLFLLLLTTSIFVNTTNIKFYEKQYNKLDLIKTTQINKQQYKDATTQLLQYINNKTDKIDIAVTIGDKTQQVFNDKEKLHMVDVKQLFQLLKRVIMGLLITLFVLLAYLYIRFKKESIKITKYFKTALILFSSILISIISVAIIDFNAFWDAFHHILFSNDLWLLNPNVDRMINMYPLPLFKSLVTLIVGWFVLGVSLIGLLSYLIRKKSL